MTGKSHWAGIGLGLGWAGPGIGPGLGLGWVWAGNSLATSGDGGWAKVVQVPRQCRKVGPGQGGQHMN